MILNKNSSLKLSILITVFIVVSLSGCFSEWHGDLAKIVISFDGAERKVYDPEDTETHKKLEHEVVLTNAAKKLTFNKSGTTFEATVTPGEWNVTVNSWIDGEIYATGSIDVILKSGLNNVTIDMHQVFFWWTWNSSTDNGGRYNSKTEVTIERIKDNSGYVVYVRGEEPNEEYDNWASQFGRVYLDYERRTATAGKTYRVTWKWKADNEPFKNVIIRYAKENQPDGSGENNYEFDDEFTIPVNEEPKSYVFTVPDNCNTDIAFMVGGDIGSFRIWDFKIEEVQIPPSSNKIIKFTHNKGINDNGESFDNWIGFYYIPPSVRGERITEGDVFTFIYSFTSNVAINGDLYINLLDGENYRWDELADKPNMTNIPSNTVVSGTVIFTANRTASSSTADANKLAFWIDTVALESPLTPTLTFTEFSVIKAQPAQGGTLKAKLDWIGNPQNNTAFIITLNKSEDFAPYDLSYNGKKVSIILKGNEQEQTISLSGNGSMFTINSNVTLILDNNITLKGRASNDASLIFINSGGTFIMNAGKICNNESTKDQGAGVFVFKGGKFFMKGGEISFNTASTDGGGGVFVFNGGTFEMSAGEISNNTTTGEGGGVSVCVWETTGIPLANSTFTMTGGTISGNTASRGGGVHIINENAAYYSTFNMSGGTISGNTATENGGGVRIWNGKFDKQIGGTISGNNATSDRAVSAGSNIPVYSHKGRDKDIPSSETLYYDGTNGTATPSEGWD